MAFVNVKDQYQTDTCHVDEYGTVSMAFKGEPNVPPTGQETPAELEGLVETREEKLVIIGDDAQLANVNMQNMMQKMQQTLQMMSNISKSCHDTAMAIIRKIGG